ncbi:MAG: CHAD domain-containing protein [Anaerolineae bacterium]|nr:CHAD domain-containing protein [Anaerolineae bacterium]
MAQDSADSVQHRVICEDSERAALERITEIGNRHEARRARLVLMSADGGDVADIALALGLSRRRVRYWQRGFVRRRLDIFSERLLARLDDQEAAGSESAALEGAPPPQPGADKPRRPLTMSKSPGVQAGDPMSEAGRKVLYFHFERMLFHEPGTRLGADIEALHDMRVATRRMRAAFRVFGGFYKDRLLKRYLAGLRATGRALGDVRDLDVFMEKVGHYQDALPEAERGGMEPLLEAWQGRRAKARARMLRHLDSPDFGIFVADFGEFLTTPGAGAQDEAALVRHVVPRLVYEGLEAVRRYETILDTAPIETLHALRIDFKRFRYTLEFFEEVLGPEARDVINEVKVMQDHLGDLNDADVAGRILQDFIATYEKKQVGCRSRSGAASTA